MKDRGKDRRRGAATVDVDRREGDRRRWRRVPVELWAETDDGEATYFNQVADLSPGGVFFATPIPHPVGTVVNIKLEVPGGPLEVRAVVANAHDDKGMGVKFVELTGEAKARIEAALEALER